MDLAKYIKVIWLYIICELLIFVGFYIIAFNYTGSNSGPIGFGIMIPGLLSCTIGGFYGKKKLIQGSSEKLPLIEAKHIDQLKQNVVSQLKPPETSADSPKAAQPRPEIRPPAEAKPVPVKEIAPPAEPSAGVQKILMCPGCNTENPPANMFCSNCGKRLKAPAKTARPKSKKKKRAKPVSR
jgi:hypothetical protein